MQATPPVGSHSPPAPPLRVQGYEIGACLGGGGFATVWEAVRLADGKLVAIKASHVTTAVAEARFAREAASLASIGPPHVPELYVHGTLPSGRPYLVMELLSGTPLAVHLGQLPAPPSLRWSREVAMAVLECLGAVHGAGLVHGDLKPENVVMSAAPRLHAKLLDFGTAKLMDHVENNTQDTFVEVVSGSTEYMAPELFAGELPDARADIYAFGVLLYELFTLRVPFVGDNASVEHGHRSLRPPRPSSFVVLPEPVEALCLACLAKEPARRPPDIDTLRDMTARAFDEAAAIAAEITEQSVRTAPLLTDSRQPVVLMVAEVPPAAISAVTDVIERYNGIIARQHGRRYVCGFSVLDDQEPAQAALAAARELVERFEARVTLHLAQLKVRRHRQGRSSRLYGTALDDTESWLPTGDWQGIMLTADIATALPEGQTRPTADRPGFFELIVESGRASAETKLVGRDSHLAAGRASFTAVLDEANPGLFTAVGESGMGKSRLAAELARQVRYACPEALVVSLRAIRQSLGSPDQTRRRLLALLAAHAPDTQPAEDDSMPVAAARVVGDRLRQVAAVQPLALIIDDAHYVEGEVLDAIEYATLDGDGIRLWIAVIVHPNLRRRRPGWGMRAYRHAEVELEPLSEGTAMQLATELLRPAEYPPAATLRRLAQWAGGSPQALEELTRTLKREGIVRKRPESESWYIATAELDRLPLSPAGQWLAARRVDTLPGELAACLRMCAVLGAEFQRDELEWVQNAADLSGTASSAVDTDIGLAELKRLGFVEEQGDAWSFRRPAFQDAVYRQLGSRERQRIHAHALEFWRRQAGEGASERSLAALARHAGASGALVEAADAYIVLGDRARCTYRDIDADEHYTAALALLSEDDHHRRARALGGRGKVRYRVQRIDDAMTDLVAARRHAEADNDRARAADLLLSEAMVLDWAEQYAESARRVSAAAPLVAELAEPVLEARYLNGLARDHFRHERMTEAITLFERAIRLAEAHGDDETRITALLVVSHALIVSNRLDEAEKRFEEVIALCEKSGDRLHLCAGYSNRVYLHSVKKSVNGTMDDLRRAVALARELGQPQAERVAAHNLAEFLHWSGKHAEAAGLARRAYALQRFLPQPVPADALLLARIYAAMGNFQRVRELLEQVHAIRATAPLPHSQELAVAMLELALAEAMQEPCSYTWEQLLSRARPLLPGEEYLEMIYFRALGAKLRRSDEDLAAAVTSAYDMLDEHPVWREPFALLAGTPGA